MRKRYLLQGVLPLFLTTEADDAIHQQWLDRLEEQKISWEHFLHEAGDCSQFSRAATSRYHRTLLHLAVLDNRLEVVSLFSQDTSAKNRRDIYGLSPLDFAQFLNRQECLAHLKPHRTSQDQEDLSSFPAHFESLSHPIFETRDALEYVLAQVDKVKQDDLISSDKIWMGIYFDKEIREALYPPVKIQYLDEQLGYGVIAEQKIRPCAFVGEYTGIIQERKSKLLKDKEYCLRYNVWEGKKNYCIDAERKGNFTRFINHSDKPNLGLQSVYWRGIPRMIFVALKEIPAGKQLTFDYGAEFWKDFRHPPKSIDDF